MSIESDLAENQTYYIKAGDRKPILSLIFYNDDGTVKNLTGVTTAKLIVASVVGGRRLVSLGVMVISGTPTDGTVTYAWATVDTELLAGNYLMEVILDYGLATQESFPRGSYYKLAIVAHL